MALMSFREPNQVKWVGMRPAHRGTQVIVRAGGLGAEFIVYTVPAGKTFYLCGLLVGFSTTAVATWGTVRVRNDLDVVQYALAGLLMDAVGQNIVAHSYWPPLEIPALWDVTVLSSAVTLECMVAINGWVE